VRRCGECGHKLHKKAAQKSSVQKYETAVQLFRGMRCQSVASTVRFDREGEAVLPQTQTGIAQESEQL